MDEITEQIHRMVKETERHAQDLLADVKDPHVMLHAVYGHISREIVKTVREMDLPLDLQTKHMWPLI